MRFAGVVQGSRWPLLIVTFITLSRGIAGVGSTIVYLADGPPPILAVLFLYVLASDLLDGFLARSMGVASLAGGILDYVVDRLNFFLILFLLVGEGVNPLLFLPFLLRDGAALAVQSLLGLPKITGTKALSVGGTIGCYLYVLLLSYGEGRSMLVEKALLVAMLISLLNMVMRILRLRTRIRVALREGARPSHSTSA